MTTKEKIMVATKQLVVSQPFDKITVTTIMAVTGMRRQSFYDHFRDKYDVLADIYSTEVKAAVKYCGNYQFWPQTLLAMLTYFDRNRLFYQHVLKLDVQNAPEEVIIAHLKTMVGEIFVSLGEAERISIDTCYCEFLQKTLGGTLFLSLKDWLYQQGDVDLQQEYQYLKAYLEDGINGFLMRTKRINHYQKRPEIA
ncbi:TetR family transcriptional regulator [Lactobacillus sp. LC28-10]|uniref:TetR family transcriptional regulator n=1 Tax=Secundilactobacillus angelensis TaxID=2722706 RepID=A0ABX1KVE8_9LACO|nr:TetR family transcriptional regulator [Secundilactobacillus angelensis]MCH5461584.1 TetR/AcrR family transcriptional regulator [Secundilactobacillus angelensis]NLR17879.1 TetR family transcriptional regulator [Secundilactobacillus angelensis]